MVEIDPSAVPTSADSVLGIADNLLRDDFKRSTVESVSFCLGVSILVVRAWDFDVVFMWRYLGFCPPALLAWPGRPSR